MAKEEWIFMNPNLADLARETKNPEVKPEVPAPHGFDYVPELGLYVARKVEQGITFQHECYVFTDGNGATMLRLDQLWKYRRFRETNNIPDTNEREWLDAIVKDKTRFTTSPPLSHKIKGSFDGLPTLNNGFFDPDECDPESGIPKVYREAKGLKKVLKYSYDWEDVEEGRGLCFVTYDNDFPSKLAVCDRRILAGVRFCYEKAEDIKLSEELKSVEECKAEEDIDW
jgi:hypothetical protein